MSRKPATNILPARRDSMEMSEDIEDGENSDLDPDSIRNRFRDVKGNIDLVDDQNKKQHEEERNDNPDVVGPEVESLQPHAYDEEGKPEDV
ncbi:hypothetical protein K4K52_008419 [Colletotrichum sp. SAR 10_76]|nr:hypothetical protein K4K52_008419 [Colletotrichum sp. SAR 10_76]